MVVNSLYWGLGNDDTHYGRKGGIYMASILARTTHIFNTKITNHHSIVGGHGHVSFLRPTLAHRTHYARTNLSGSLIERRMSRYRFKRLQQDSFFGLLPVGFRFGMNGIRRGIGLGLSRPP